MADHELLESTPPAPASNALLLIISWLWVAVPLGWGVWETVRSSLPLFH